MHYSINPEIERKEILKRYRNLLISCKNTNKQDNKLIRKAFNLAVDAHKDMRRKTGEPYIYHPIAVARITVTEIGLDVTSVVCALLHDVVEDTDYTLDDMRGIFGKKIAKIIDGLTKISGIFDQSTSFSIQAENFKKMLFTLSDDVRVILIKIADRLHNMRTLDAMPHEKQLKIASETSYIYAPLAHRLGFYNIKDELEDLSLKYTEPEIYQSISLKLKETELERKKFITKFKYPIIKALKAKNVKHKIIDRTKSISSIWNKMNKKGIIFEEVYDLFAVRIIINSSLSEHERNDCWNVYSVITDLYRPNPNRLRDWISIPKANGYEALHTTVMSKTGDWVEVQIRSERMNQIAEKGYAAHWKYKESVKQESSLDKWLIRISELLKSNESDALDFVDDFKLNLFSKEIFVFTPKGELRTLPAGSTILDFAYGIHSQIGNNCISANVNHKLVPLKYELKSGDQAEIITSKKQRPKEDWLKLVITARAKSKIKDFIKKEKKKLIIQGEKILKKLFEQVKLKYDISNINKLKSYYNIDKEQDIFYNVATNKIGLKEIKTFYNDNKTWHKYISFKNPFTKSKKTEDKTIEKDIINLKNKPSTLLLGDKTSKIKYKLSLCCNPIPGDEVFGLIFSNKKIEVHRTNCKHATQLMSRYGNRIVQAKWINENSLAFLAKIKFTGIDKIGIINNITKVISNELNINIHSINFDSNDGIFEGTIALFIEDRQRLNYLIKNMEKINGIKKVLRIKI